MPLSCSARSSSICIAPRCEAAALSARAAFMYLCEKARLVWPASQSISANGPRLAEAADRPELDLAFVLEGELAEASGLGGCFPHGHVPLDGERVQVHLRCTASQSNSEFTVARQERLIGLSWSVCRVRLE